MVFRIVVCMIVGIRVWVRCIIRSRIRNYVSRTVKKNGMLRRGNWLMGRKSDVGGSKSKLFIHILIIILFLYLSKTPLITRIMNTIIL